MYQALYVKYFEVIITLWLHPFHASIAGIKKQGVSITPCFLQNIILFYYAQLKIQLLF